MSGESKKSPAIFGWELILDVHRCDPARIATKEKLLEFVVKVCEVLDMKRYGEPVAEWFGHGRPETLGFTVVQLIETSSITMHVSEYTKTVYLNIFSCKPYDRAKVKAFCIEFFGAESATDHYVERP
jgi:S-adenosylmethionine/arginine decarboxylase-like enzyme